MQKKQDYEFLFKERRSMSRIAGTACGLLFCLTTSVFATNNLPSSFPTDETAIIDQVGRTITITVSDNAGPVVGANVVVKGTTNGSISDIDGKATLLNVPNNAVLVISYIGYVTQEIQVGNQRNYKVHLMEDSEALEEVVVIGYGSLDKKQVTSAITSLKADDLMVGVGGSDISSSLQGKIGGLVMNNVGSANAGTTFQLRGMTSINAGREPLIVIDGFPGGDIRSLTQSDIKSIDV